MIINIELWMSTGVNSGVSNIAHLGGMVVGFVYLKSRVPGIRLKLPDWRGAYRQWKLPARQEKVPGLHEEAGPWSWVDVLTPPRAFQDTPAGVLPKRSAYAKLRGAPSRPLI